MLLSVLSFTYIFFFFFGGESVNGHSSVHNGWLKGTLPSQSFQKSDRDLKSYSFLVVRGEQPV